MSDTTFILSREDYEIYKEMHPELEQPEDEWEIYGVKFVKSKSCTENRAMRRAKKRKKP